MFDEYPDVLNIDEFSEMMGIGKTMAYRLLKSSSVQHFKIGSHYRIPKNAVIDYIIKSCGNKAFSGC